MAFFLFAAIACAHDAPSNYYLPNAEDSKIVTVTKSGQAAAAITVVTQAVAEREVENGAQTCQVYAFVPSFIVVHRDEPTQISFRNYQADDDHDFMLVGPDQKVLMFVSLPKLKETSYVFTFHKEGLFRIYCTMHQPQMSAQILVLPPVGAKSDSNPAPAAASTNATPSDNYAATLTEASKESRLPDCRVWGRQLEEEMTESIRKKDWDAVTKLISPAFQSVGADRVRNRAEELAWLKGIRFTSGDRAFRVTHSGDVAILTYDNFHYVASSGGKPQKITSRVLSVRRMTNAGWQWIAHSETPVAPTGQSN